LSLLQFIQSLIILVSILYVFVSYTTANHVLAVVCFSHAFSSRRQAGWRW